MEYEEATRLLNKYDGDYGELLRFVSSRADGVQASTVITVVLQLKIATLEERIEELEASQDLRSPWQDPDDE